MIDPLSIDQKVGTMPPVQAPIDPRQLRSYDDLDFSALRRHVDERAQQQQRFLRRTTKQMEDITPKLLRENRGALDQFLLGQLVHAVAVTTRKLEKGKLCDVFFRVVPVRSVSWPSTRQLRAEAMLKTPWMVNSEHVIGSSDVTIEIHVNHARVVGLLSHQLKALGYPEIVERRGNRECTFVLTLPLSL